jgi:arylsulfatase A-like enzyme
MSMRQLVACLSFVLIRLVSVATAADDRPPNIVLIISDDQAWTDFGFMGHDAIETPHLDRLASESLVFDHGYVPSSLCCPSLASIITGRYPHQHRITGNEPPRPSGVGYGNPEYRAAVREMVDLIDESPTLPTMLKDKGYVSLQTGKWWLGDFRRGGFTHGMTHGDPDRGGRHGDAGLAIGRTTMQPIRDFLDAAGDRPFFIWYAPFLPHTPHDAREALVEKYAEKTDSPRLARYWANCEWFDETCGELLDHLDATGHADDTIVLFVTDNGWIQQSDGPRYAPRSKRSPYDGGLRTPIMVRWPGHVAAGIVSVPVSSVDLAPTILTACGVDVPDDLPGVDLLDADAVSVRDAIFGDVHLHNAVDLHDPARNLTHRWCIHDGWKLIVPNPVNMPDGVVELFRIAEDPLETTDIAADHPARVAMLRAKLDAWWAARPGNQGDAAVAP